MAEVVATTVADTLTEIARWFSDEGSRKQNEMVEVDQEIRSLETAIGNLQQQLDALRTFRTDLGNKVRVLQTGHVHRAYQSVFDLMRQYSARLSERELLVVERERERRASIPLDLAGGELGPLVEEYRQFKAQVEPTLKSLPESYRSVLLEHHKTLSDRLRAHLQASVGTPIEVEGDRCPVEFVYAIDAPDGDPDLLVCVLPVPEEVHTEWAARPEGVSTWVAARVVQAVYQAAATASFVGAEVVAGGHQGLLVIEVDLEGADASFVQAFERRVAEILTAAPELKAAKVSVLPVRVDIDYVVPPELPEAVVQDVSEQGEHEVADA